MFTTMLVCCFYYLCTKQNRYTKRISKRFFTPCTRKFCDCDTYYFADDHDHGAGSYRYLGRAILHIRSTAETRRVTSSPARLPNNMIIILCAPGWQNARLTCAGRNILSAWKTASACRPPGKSQRRKGPRAFHFSRKALRSAAAASCDPGTGKTVSAMQSNFHGESFSSKQFFARS